MRGKRQKKNITLISVTHYKYQSQILTVSTENVPVHHWGSPQLCGAINYNTLEQVEDKYKLKCCYLNLKTGLRILQVSSLHLGTILIL